jgi:hypothetical protein
MRKRKKGGAIEEMEHDLGGLLYLEEIADNFGETSDWQIDWTFSARDGSPSVVLSISILPEEMHEITFTRRGIPARIRRCYEIYDHRSNTVTVGFEGDDERPFVALSWTTDPESRPIIEIEEGPVILAPAEGERRTAVLWGIELT